ncbi:MAG: hypothetical protein P0111_11870 [Nitrospira sp.]|nr:hypothetical protein [Nitrospira sp.]
MKTQQVLVLDNYHGLASHSPIHEMLSLGMNSLPTGKSAIIISREAPPQAFSRLELNRALREFEPQALQLSESEARDIVDLWAKRKNRAFSSRDVRAIYERVQGWTAGLVLMLEQDYQGHVDTTKWQESTPEVIFDYLAAEAMKGLDEQIQHLLLKTSWFPAFTAEMAQELSGTRQAREILERLYRGRYFTERRAEDQVFYQYHPLFREFLIKTAHRRYGKNQTNSLRCQAAALLADASRAEDAIELLEQAGVVEARVRIVLNVAAEMFAQGRMRTVEEWLGRLPVHTVANNPWLLFWEANCKFPFSPQEARDTYLRSYRSFEQSQDRVGQVLACCGILESHVYTYGEMDKAVGWVDRIQELIRDDFEFPTAEIEARILFASFTALMWCRPQDPILPIWKDRIMVLLPQLPDMGRRGLVGLQIATYHYWKGELNESWQIVKLLLERSSRNSSLPMFRLPIYLAEACLGWCTGSLDQSLMSIDKGLALSHASGITYYVPFFLAQGVFASLVFGDVSQGKKFLGELQKTPHQPGLAGMAIHYLSAWVAHLLGNTEEALSHIESSIAINVKSEAWFPEGLDRIAAAQILYAKDDLKEGERHLERAWEIGQMTESKTLQFVSLLTKSLFELHRGNEEKAIGHLRVGLPLGRSCNSRYMPSWRSDAAALVLSTALQAQIEVEYVSELIHDFNLKPEGLATLNPAWPWPIKIVTLGRFSLMINGAPASFPRKSPHRLLDLLKTLVATVSNGEVSEQRLVDALWPDAEGDRGHEALKKNLQRLQSLIGKESLHFRGGTVYLNEDTCWVDAIAFEKATKKLETPELHDDHSWSRLANATLLLYQGPFLPADEDKPWSFPLRDRLRQRVVSLFGRIKARSGNTLPQNANLTRILEADPALPHLSSSTASE